MPRFSQSLFDSIRDFGRMSPTEGRRQALQQESPYQQMGTTDPLARGIGQMLGGLTGKPLTYLQTAPERIAAQTKGLDMSKAEDIAKAMLVRAQYIQDPQAQAVMIMKAQELMQGVKERKKAEKATAGEKALVEYGSASNIDLEDPKTKEYFFRLGTTYNVPFETANSIYKEFTGKDKGEMTTKDEVVLRDSKGNLYTRAVQYSKTGQTREVLTPFPGSPKKPAGGLTIVSGTTGVGGEDKPRLTGEAEESQEYASLRVDAVAKLPDLVNTSDNLQAAIDLLESGAVKTGGITRRLSRGLTDFLGTTPKNLGEFETRLAEEVLARLESFTGAISEGERQFLVDNIGSYLESGESNIGRLQTLLGRANRLMQNSVLIAKSKTFDDYRSSVLSSVEERQFNFVPEAERKEAMEAVKRGEITLEELRSMY